MGENFYIRHKKCESCGKLLEEDIHICKLSCGWKPIFESFKDLDSVQKFKDYIEENNCDIVDEYNRAHDQKEFWKTTESWNNIEKLKSHSPYWNDKYKGFFDFEGYEFYEGYFS